MFKILPQTYRGQELELEMRDFWQKNNDPFALIAAYDQKLTDHTVFMAEHGVSHRPNLPVQVGAVIIGLFRNNPILNEGNNYSPVKGMQKDCAEIRALRMGDERIHQIIELDQIAAYGEAELSWTALKLKVVAPNQLNLNFEINGRRARTLHPCAEPCRKILKQHSAFYDHMPVDMYAVDLSCRRVCVKESTTIREMFSLYKEIEPPKTSAEQLTRG